MATYKVDDPTTGKSVTLEGDSPPSEDELNQIFSTVHGTPRQPQSYNWSLPTGQDVLRGTMDAVSNSPLGIVSKGAQALQTGLGKVANAFQTPVSQPIQQGAQALFGGSRALGVGAANMLVTPPTPTNILGSEQRMKEAYQPTYQPPNKLEAIGSTIGENAPIAAATALSPNLGGPLSMMAQQAQKGSVSPVPLALGGLAKATESVGPTLAEKAGTSLENAGGKMASGVADILPNTVRKLAYKFSPTGNPIEAGSKIGQKLIDDGILEGNTTSDIFDNVQSKLETAGKSVGDAKQAIQDESLKYGGIEDPTLINPKKILSDLKLKIYELNDSDLPSDQTTGKMYQSVYDKLIGRSELNDGKLSLEDLQKSLTNVGRKLGRTNPTHPDYGDYSELYGILADGRENMVNQIADNAKNPELASNLKNSNSEYNFYSSVLKDVTKSAAREGAGRGMGGGMTGHLSRLAALYALIRGKPGEAVALGLGGKVMPLIEEELGSTSAKDITGLGRGIKNIAPSLRKGPSSLMQGLGASKVVDEAIANQLLKETNGDVEEARRLAKERGMTIPYGL